MRDDYLTNCADPPPKNGTEPGFAVPRKLPVRLGLWAWPSAELCVQDGGSCLPPRSCEAGRLGTGSSVLLGGRTCGAGSTGTGHLQAADGSQKRKCHRQQGSGGHRETSRPTNVGLGARKQEGREVCWGRFVHQSGCSVVQIGLLSVNGAHTLGEHQLVPTHWHTTQANQVRGPG